MSIRFFLANPQSPKSSIDVIVRFRGKRYKKGIGVSVESRYWNPDRQAASVNQRYRDGVVVNYKIDIWTGAIERFIHKAVIDNIVVSDADQFWKLIHCEIEGLPYTSVTAKNVFLTDYIHDIFIPKFISSKSESRIKRFRVIESILRNYEAEQNDRLRFADINQIFYRNFLEWAKRQKYSQNYFGTIIKIVKQVMGEARDFDNLHDNREYVSLKVLRQDVDTIYLTVDELRKIYETPIDDEFIMDTFPNASGVKIEQLKLSFTIAKNRFLIGAFTGFRVSDFMELRKENIQNSRISVVTKKTNDKVTVPIHPIVQEILNSGFDLQLSLSEQKVRDHIKIICKRAKIDEWIEVRSKELGEEEAGRYRKWQLVSTHTARRSFATNAYLDKSIPVAAIMKVTGHKTEREFMKYIRITNEESAEILANSNLFKK